MKKIILLLLCITPLFAESDFLQGNLYVSEKLFEKAIESYEKDISINGDSFNTYYNMAGAWLGLNKPGNALLSYEKARLINPADGDLKLKIQSLREQNSLEESPKNLFSAAAHSLTPGTWFTISAIGLLTAALLFLLMGIFHKNKEFIILRFYKIALIVTLTLFISGGFMTIIYLTEKNQAIVLNDTSIKVSPYNTADESFSLKEGTLVKIKEQWQDFFFIEDTSNRYGWIPVSEAGKIWNE